MPRTDGRPMLCAIVAKGRNGAIGRDNALPWRMPTDLSRFRELTIGKPMIMGRRTFESIGRVLPGRESIVVTANAGLRLDEGVHKAASPERAIEIAAARATAMGADDIAVIGGASLFEALEPEIERFHVTIVEMSPDADTFYHGPDPALWREVSCDRPPRAFEDEADCLFLEFHRKLPPEL